MGYPLGHSNGLTVALQTATTVKWRPEAVTSRFMSSRSLVRIIAFSREAIATTTASTTSVVRALPSSRPASCASVSPSGTTAQPARKRRSWACCGERLTCATTGAGTKGRTPNSKRTLCSSHARRSFLSAATRTAASYRTLFTPDAEAVAKPATALPPCHELHSSLPW